MTNSGALRDLVVLVADTDTQYALRGIISRALSLGIETLDVTYRIHPRHDPGCLNKPEEILRRYCDSHRYALVVLDYDGCGRKKESPAEIAKEIEQLLDKNGWHERAAAIVIDPELEAWVWSDSLHVDEKLGWSDRRPEVRAWLQENTNVWPAGELKPKLPKEAMEKALFMANKVRSAAIYEEIAKKVSFKRCTDPAFAKLKATLKRWFSENQ